MDGLISGLTAGLTTETEDEAAESDDSSESGGDTTEVVKKTVITVTDKEQQYKVRIRVLEARRLKQGEVIHPVVRVIMGEQKKQTDVIPAQNDPVFDNAIFMIEQHCFLKELLAENISFQVHDSLKPRSAALIGSHKVELQTVYDQPKHVLKRKWLVLGDPKDTLGTVKGFLKISVAILLPGQKFVKEKSADDVVEDTESNMIIPAGVQLHDSVFWLRVFKAEDLPPAIPKGILEKQKKARKKGEIFTLANKATMDPKLIYQFAGKKLSTDVMKVTDHPEWYEELRIGVKFPTLAEKLKISIIDWNGPELPDPVGTCIKNLSEICLPGCAGFMPSFGPTYMCLYGAPRELNSLPEDYDELNRGQGSGVAYHGRVLVEFGAYLGKKPEKTKVDIPSKEFMKLLPFMRRRKYILAVVLFSCSMIYEYDDPVKIDISIGNYGNSLDPLSSPMPSSTANGHAAFDGNAYYYLPWADQKECLLVASDWEDISFRLGAANMIHKLIHRIEQDLDEIQHLQAAQAPIPDIAAVLIPLLNYIHEYCSKPLPVVDPEQCIGNNLDLQLYKLRSRELRRLSEHAFNLMEYSTDVTKTVQATTLILEDINKLLVEPQNSIPDVFVWMISEGKRVAYYRIPTHQVFFFDNDDQNGKFCGKMQSIFLKFPGREGETGSLCNTIAGQLRFKMWMGLESDFKKWEDMHPEAEIVYYAETYENQLEDGKKWIELPATADRPSFSDTDGNLLLPKANFKQPSSWNFHGDWSVNPDEKIDADAGLTEYMQCVYENEMKDVSNIWRPATLYYTDTTDCETDDKVNLKAPVGWEWSGEWTASLNRAVDEYGWEYSESAESMEVSSYPVSKYYHKFRRRMWQRSRTRVMDSSKISEIKAKLVDKDGWEYAASFKSVFHDIEQKFDKSRRRRWQRELKPASDDAHPVFFFEMPQADATIVKEFPKIYVNYNKSHTYQLRAYIYQARDLLPADLDGFSDPYAQVVCMNQSKSTQSIESTLWPIWDETLVLDEIPMHGEHSEILSCPPQICVEIYDKNLIGMPVFLGRLITKPIIKLDPNDGRTAMLKWYRLVNGGKFAGTLLASFELFLKDDNDLPFISSDDGEICRVPTGIRPVVENTRVEILLWGLRGVKNFKNSPVISPFVEIEFNGKIIQSAKMEDNSKLPNFKKSVYSLELPLPKESIYAPPITLKVREERNYGRRPVIGHHVEKSITKFRCSTPAVTDATSGDVIVDMSSSTTASSKSGKKVKMVFESGLDWWCKYYASVGEHDKCADYLTRGLPCVTVYDCELENVPEFEGLNDFLHTFWLQKQVKDEDEEDVKCGELQCNFKIYPLPDDTKSEDIPMVFSKLPSSCVKSCIVRIYLVCASNLAAKDDDGFSDPYVIMSCGSKKISDRDNYTAKTLNPTFGAMFQMKVKIPFEKNLKISLMDWDDLEPDDLIGETIIDLEHRLYSCHRALCGLPQQYYLSGISTWRDTERPSDILSSYCYQHGLEHPFYTESTSSLTIGDAVYYLSDYEGVRLDTTNLGPVDERLALHVLNTFPLVHEHVETRTLYSPLQPGKSQGKLRMWLDIFPSSVGLPGIPLDLTPRLPRNYECRVVILNTRDVEVTDEGLAKMGACLQSVAKNVPLSGLCVNKGPNMGDIYVKGWIDGINESQKTDVHFRALDGEGMFNWRFVFGFNYVAYNKKILHEEQDSDDEDETTVVEVPPQLIIEVWDDDTLQFNDCIGRIEMNLLQFPVAAKEPEDCSLLQLPGSPTKKGPAPSINLFRQTMAKGWYPVYSSSAFVSSKPKLTGKVEMLIEIITAPAALAKPAGRGRDPPNLNPELKPPSRPEGQLDTAASFLRTIKFFFKKYGTRAMVMRLGATVLTLFGTFGFTSLPGSLIDAAMEKMGLST